MANKSFKQRVFDVVGKIPRGKVMTYKEVASAAGNIMAANNNPAVPCHRVIHSDGTLGGYNGGVDKKEIKLRKEGLTVVLGRVKMS